MALTQALTSLPTEVITLIIWDARESFNALALTCKALNNIINDPSKPFYWRRQFSKILLQLPQIKCTHRYTLIETPKGKKMIINAGANNRFYEVYDSKGKFVKVTMYNNREIVKHPKCRYNIDNLIRNLDFLCDTREILA